MPCHDERDAAPGVLRRTVLQALALPTLAGAAGNAVAVPSTETEHMTHDARPANASLTRAGLRTSDTQLLFADLQPELISSSLTVSPDMLAKSVGALAAAAKILGLPMTFSVAPQGGRAAHVIPELAPFANAGNTFSRTPASPFLDAPTVAALAAHKRSTLVIAGFAAEVVVLHAALDGLEAGYAVHVPVDAVGSRSARTESAVFEQINRAGGVATSIMTVMTRLEPELTRPPGSDALAALKVLRGD